MEKSKYKKIITPFTLILLCCVIFTGKAHAQTIVSQDSFVDTMVLQNNYNLASPHATYSVNFVVNASSSGLTGTAYSFTIYTTDPHSQWDDLISYQGYNAFSLNGCSIPFGDYSVGCMGTSVGYFASSHSWNGNYLTFTFSSPVSLNSSYYYFLGLNTSLNQIVTWHIGGIDTGACMMYDLYNYIAGVHNTNCSSPAIKYPMYSLNGIGGYIPPSGDTSTRIIDFSPQQNSTTTSPVTFSFHIYISPDDVGNIISVKTTFDNVDQNALAYVPILNVFDNDKLLYEEVATTSGDVYFSTSTISLPNGNYRAHLVLRKSLFGVTTDILPSIFGWSVGNALTTITEMSHNFIVGDNTNGYNGTFVGNLTQNGRKILGLDNASTSVSLSIAEACIPIKASGTFGFEYNASSSVSACLSYMFIPDTEYLNETLTGFKDGVLNRFPLGYATRFYTIMTSSSTAELPSVSIPLQIEASTSSALYFDFDFNDMVIGAGTALESIQDPFYGKTPRGVLEPFVQSGVALATILTIVYDLFGGRGGGIGGRGGGKKGKKLS